MAEIRVRARAVDMLGRQQIAGIPNAIHELFKNAHDAYAEHVEVDFFRRTRLLVLRDDGLGMTKEDVEGRWLTLGTESRIGANAPNAKVWTGRKKLPRRVVMGEKGIGRLAVAVIAPLTLLLTRAEREEGLHDLVAVLVHWGLFEVPGVDLGQIHIPIRIFPGGTLPSSNDVQNMASEVQENIHQLNIPEDFHNRIVNDLNKISTIDPERLDESVNLKSKRRLTLKGDNSGSWFIVAPTVPELEDDIDTVPAKGDTPLRKILLGFANTMDDKHVPVIETEFRDHKKDGEVVELIGGMSFFTNNDFASVDHLIDGTFDEFGQFKGNISIYRREPREFVCNWSDGKGRMSRCGPFSLKIGYIMGNRDESLLDGLDHGNMIKRLDKLGGLYIYRDGVRILPYGNWDNDFLSVEHRRTLSANDWFYSFRRMFGYISISHSKNSALTEKAGREGFRENMAYRDFRSIAESLFKETAIRFFREASPLSDEYWDRKKELKREAKLLEKLKAKADERRTEFQRALRAFRGLVDSNHFELTTLGAQERYEARLGGIEDLSDPAEVAEQLLALENDFREETRALERQLTLQKPRGLSLTKTLQKEWDTYERLAPQIRARSVGKLREEIGTRIAETAQRRIDAHRRREAALKTLGGDRNSLIKELSELKRRSYELSDRFQKTLKEVVREEFSALHDQLETLVGEFGRCSAADGSWIDKGLLEASDKIDLLRREETEALRALIRQLEDALDGLREKVTVDDRATALEEKVARLEETLDFQAEFFQVGMTVGILGHEFEKAAANLREGMHELKRWADANAGLRRTYDKLRNSYEHLESYLKLLDPLGRRMNTRPVDISGAQIINTVSRTFAPQMESAGITLTITPAFRNFSLNCRASALLGAIVNIVDNAVFWVKRSESGDHRVIMDADEIGLLISNTGPGISAFDAERIFEFGFTTKPGGRGMGLAVSRDVLAKEGLVLELLECRYSEPPVFRIRPEEAE